MNLLPVKEIKELLVEGQQPLVERLDRIIKLLESIAGQTATVRIKGTLPEEER